MEFPFAPIPYVMLSHTSSKSPQLYWKAKCKWLLMPSVCIVVKQYCFTAHIGLLLHLEASGLAVSELTDEEY
jgi:hypothetical protein